MALVAIVFGGANLIGVVTMSLIIAAEDQPNQLQIVKKLFLCGIFAGLMNSNVNLFIYVFASTNFRATCFHLWRQSLNSLDKSTAAHFCRRLFPASGLRDSPAIGPSIHWSVGNARVEISPE